MSESRRDVTLDITIRNALPQDAGAYLQLVKTFAEFEKLPPPDAEAQRRLIDDLFRPRPRYRLLVVDAGGQVVGYAAYSLSYSTFQAKPVFFLDDLFVLNEYWNQRIGHRLFAYCAKTAAAEGCCRMEFLVLDWNTRALEFYKRHGVPALSNWVVHRVEGESLHRLSALASH